MTCIAIANTKGGSGKTTLTANLGAYLACCGWRVLLIDADIQPTLSNYFPIEANKTGLIRGPEHERRLHISFVAGGNGSAGSGHIPRGAGKGTGADDAGHGTAGRLPVQDIFHFTV